MNKPFKIILTILALAAFSFVCFFLFVLFGFAGQDFYMGLTAIAYLLLVVLIPVSIFRLFSRRTRWILGGILLGGIVLAPIARESVRAYHNSFERVTETKVDLDAYAPFAETTRAAELDSASVLKLRDSLPRLDGATALYPVYAAFARAVYPEKSYSVHNSEVACHTTARAYDALIEGEADIIFVLQPSGEQLGMAAQQGVEMVFTPIGREAFVFFVNAENPVSGLSVKQLRDIYSGRTTHWKELGGRNSKIRAFQREEGSGSQTAFLQFMEGSDIMIPPRNDVIHGMGGIINRTASYANYPNAIGYTFRFYAESMVGNDGIRILSVDGVYPTRETIRSGEYPRASEFYTVTRAGETNPNVALLVEWILSEQGQNLVEKTGYNPVR